MSPGYVSDFQLADLYYRGSMYHTNQEATSYLDVFEIQSENTIAIPHFGLFARRWVVKCRKYRKGPRLDARDLENRMMTERVVHWAANSPAPHNVTHWKSHESRRRETVYFILYHNTAAIDYTYYRYCLRQPEIARASDVLSTREAFMGHRQSGSPLARRGAADHISAKC